IELLLKCLKTAEPLQRLVDVLARALASRRQAVPEETVIPRLRCIVEDVAGGLRYQLLERCVFEFRAADQLVDLVDISLVMFAIVIIQRLTRHMRLEGIVRVRQGWKNDR